MAQEKSDAIKLGDRVRLLSPGRPLFGRVVELRGPLGPKGAQIYRVRLGRKPKPAYIEVRGDQLEPAPESSATVTRLHAPVMISRAASFDARDVKRLPDEATTDPFGRLAAMAAEK